MKKRIVFILCALLVLALPLAVGASALGGGIEVLCRDVSLVKSGLSGQKMQFSETDFKQALGVPSVKKVKILTLPDEEDGVLMLGETPVAVNETVKRRSLGALSFIPKSKDVSEADFTFLVPGAAANGTFTCTMKFLDKVNAAPVPAESVALLTQSGIPVHGKLGGTDPEGDEIEFIVLSYPKNGVLTLTDKHEGTYRYTPSRETVGKDSFRYVLRDCYGNYSAVCEAAVRVDDRVSEMTFRDMDGRNSYVAAVTLDALGVMHGVKDGDEWTFCPDGNVTRAEFLAMAMKATDFRCDESVAETFFDDGGEIPAELTVYVSNAQKRGIVTGTFEDGALKFRPNAPVTGAEASVILSRLLGNDAASAISEDGSVPVWARAEVGSLESKGILTPAAGAYREPITREQAAEMLYSVVKHLEK